MNHSLPILQHRRRSALPPAVLLMLSWLLLGQSVHAAPPDGPRPATPSPAPGSPNLASRHTAAADAGQQLIRQAAQWLGQRPSLEAKLRQRTWLFGQELSGTGRYRQLRHNDRLMVHWELRMQVNERTSRLRHVSDGRRLWIHRQFPDQPEQLGLVDLDRVRAAVTARPTRPPRHLDAILLGGLPGLLATLDQSFRFEPPVPHTLGKHAVWIARGTWNPPSPEEPASKGAPPPAKAAPATPLPPHMPQSVAVTLSRDESLPLFPLRIDFERAEAGEPSRPILRIELYEIRSGPLSPQSFLLDSSNQQSVLDETEPFIIRLSGQVGADQP